MLGIKKNWLSIIVKVIPFCNWLVLTQSVSRAPQCVTIQKEEYRVVLLIGVIVYHIMFQIFKKRKSKSTDTDEQMGAQWLKV